MLILTRFHVFLKCWSMPYGNVIRQGHMARPYGNAIWQGHMARPYGSRGRGCRRGRGLCFVLEGTTFSGILALKNDMLKNRNPMFLIKIELVLHI